MKGRRKSESNTDHWRSLRKRPQEEGTHELSTLLPDQRDESVSKAREWSPKKRHTIKKTKKIKSSQVSCSVADASKSRRHSSFATLPLRESSSNVNKTLNTSVKRHKESTPAKEISYDKSAKQSLIEPVQSPVTTVVTNEAVRESHGDALDIHGRTFKKNKPNPRDKRQSCYYNSRNSQRRRPLRIKPSSVIKKKIHVSKTGTGPFQPCIDYGPDTIDVPESVEIPERESKKDETSKNISNKLNRNAILSDSTKDTRQIIQNQRNYAESDSHASTVEDYPFLNSSAYLTSKSDQHTGMLIPENQNDIGNNDFSDVPMSSVKKTKKRRLRIISDYDEASRQKKSSSKPELSPTRKSPSKPEESTVPKGRPRMPKESSIEEKSPSKPKESPVPKGRPRMPKEASIEEKSPSKPEEFPVPKVRPRTELMEGSTTTAREASRQEESACYPKRRIAPTFIRSLREESVQSPVTTVMTNEEAVRESNRDVLDIHGRTLITSELTEGSTAISKEAASVPEKSPCKAKRKTTFIKSLREEPVQSPVTTVVTNEAVRESHGDALDIHGRTFKKNKPNPRDKRVSKRRERTSDTFSGCAKDIKRVTPKIPRPSSNLVITTAKIRKEEGPLRIKPSSVIKKKIHVSKTGTGPFQPCIDYGPDTIDVPESVEIPERESKKDETSKNISNKLNRNAFLSDSTKDARQTIQNQRNYAESDSDSSTVEVYPFMHRSTYVTSKSDSDTSTVVENPLINRSKYVTSKSDQHTGMQTPKKRPLNENDIDNNDCSEVHMSSVKKPKKRKLRIISDSDEASRQEKSSTKPEYCPVTRGKSTIPIEASGQERSPSNTEHCPVTRGRFRNSVYQLRPKNSSSVLEEPSVKRKRPRVTVEHFEPEETPSEPEQSPVKKEKTRINSGLYQKKSASKIITPRSENEEEPLRIKPSITKERHADCSVKKSQKHAYQTRSNVQVEYDSSRTSPMKRKSSMGTSFIHPNHLGPEASVIESETSPKKIPQVTGDQLNHSRQKKLSANAKTSKNKRPAPFDNNEFQSDLEENSMPIVKRKENRMAVSGKNKRSRSPMKRTISRKHDKQSKDISEPANGLRRSTRFRVPPLDIWRNERLVFETLPSGEVKCRVDKGTEEDKAGLIRIAKREERRIQMSKKKVQTVKKTPIVDIKTGETVHALLHRPFESLQWSSSPNEVERPPPYIMVKAFRSKSTSFGFLEISPFAIKETQYSPLDNIHYVLMKGHLEVVIQNTTFTFKAGDSWIVPLGAPFSFKNCSRARALLSFTTFTSPFYEHQFAE
ncbi:CENP-C_C domain-containing protein [Trichonephila inaurata madagascariensis]|uniref:CENP-C_C domain-containing protein n=1 Tax=Trichonephila inaurata madagascariensis TaxID=2747483 RepID=A0A8X6YMZ9_9ARAC|nr:CENP-C_C domain-containing protein [Trichonephila inaurata madagascariensis]